MLTKNIAVMKKAIIITHNLSIGKPLHVQDNNRYNPNGACGATGAANGIVSAEAPFVWDKKENPQMEDHIMADLRLPATRKALEKKYPGAGFNPWNSSEFIVRSVNKLAGQIICKIQEETTLQDIIYNIAIKKNPIVMGGKFTPSRHFVCTVGFITSQTDINQISSPADVNLKFLNSMIIDDSWGNYMTKYKNKNGNDNVFPVDVYKSIAMDNKKIKTAQVYFYKGIPN